MKVAYLIITHRNPGLLQRLINHLSGEDSAFYIHVDAKSDIDRFARVKGQNVHFTKKRVPVYWGEFGQVTACLTLLEEALNSSFAPDYLMLFTGSEFALRSKRYIHAFLEKNRGDEFITMAKTPSPGKPLDRVNIIRYPSSRPVTRFVFRVLAKAGFARRDYREFFGGLEPYSGVGWWSLTDSACRYILDFAKRDQTIARFFQHAHASDEAYVHTILGNSPYRERARRCFLLEDWSAGAWHPGMITDEHLRRFEAEDAVMVTDSDGTAEAMFARKYSDDQLDLVDRTTAMIERKEQRTAHAVVA